MKTEHWTDKHIKEVNGSFVAYDEAGLEHGKYSSQDEARDALVVYAATQLRSVEKPPEKPTGTTVEQVTKAILFVDCGNTADWKENTDLGEAAVKAMQHAGYDVEAIKDEAVVDRWALEIKEKMAESRAKGRSGWDDRNLCSDESLAYMLANHLTRKNARNYVDIAILAMMLHTREALPLSSITDLERHF